MKMIFGLVFILLTSFFVSCTPKLNVAGTWRITNYEATPPGQKARSFHDIGTISFKKNGEGEKNISYAPEGKAMTDQSPFGWYRTGNWVGIESHGSDFSRTWIITDRKKHWQKWRSTDAKTGVQVMELRR